MKLIRPEHDTEGAVTVPGRFRTIASALTVTALVSASCGAATTAPQEAGLSPGERRVTGAEVSEMIATIKQDFASSEAAFNECVWDMGFDYTPRRIAEVILSAPQTGLLTMKESAKEFGYGIVEGEGNAGLVVTIDGGGVPPNQADRFDAMMLTGVDCAELYYYDDPQAQISELRTKLNLLSDSVLADARIVDAMKSWSACMNNAGYRFASPQAAFQNIEQRYSSLNSSSLRFDDDRAELLRTEIRVATADFECQESTIFPALEEVLR